MEQFKKDWANDELVAEICTRLYNYLEDPANRLDHFSFYHLANATRLNDDKRLSKALQYLSSPRCEVLTQIFFYFDIDESWEFESADMIDFFKEGRFAHPRTGAVMNLDAISVAFAIGKHFLEARQKL
ncbi:hypothetical protein QPK32_04105 [Massilia sp. YIM B02763]|uniref:hypothetical protein n=1 Tax=Massilia sp. YIM B02763 TaxID=3050130 RepID=UPI0025B6764C|nr:hypothetical protein [Massilia sp. YIM B02763]MDN4052248.1 hypothetical protein [Massilia sp. YIM B02763]